MHLASQICVLEYGIVQFELNVYFVESSEAKTKLKGVVLYVEWMRVVFSGKKASARNFFLA